MGSSAVDKTLDSVRPTTYTNIVRSSRQEQIAESITISTATAAMPDRGAVIRYCSSLIRDIIAWDVSTWKSAIFLWDRLFPEMTEKLVLDIGARDGGLSLYFALRGCNVVCSDIYSPGEKALRLHRDYRVSDRISYEKIDATAIDCGDNCFDFVCMKSVMPSIGYDGRANQQKAMGEIYRVLKPGGSLLFAENLAATRVHMYFRSRFTNWGDKVRYIHLAELPELFSDFQALHFTSHGFLAVFGRSEMQRSILHCLDRIIEPLISDYSKYLVVGCATK